MSRRARERQEASDAKHYPERELVRQLGEKLYGKRPEAAHG